MSGTEAVVHLIMEEAARAQEICKGSVANGDQTCIHENGKKSLQTKEMRFRICGENVLNQGKEFY